jgi:biotin-(acetyl-CoA carboxylase) ligase
MKRLILSNVNSQEVRKKSDPMVVPPEYLTRFDQIFQKYKQYSFMLLLNDAIRAKDLSPQAVTLKKVSKYIHTTSPRTIYSPLRS